MTAVSESDAEAAPPRTSELVLAFLRDFQGERVTVGELMAVLNNRAFGLIMLALALPNAVPAPWIPGVSTAFGIPVAFFAAQIMLGRRTPWMPRFVRRRSFGREAFARAVHRGLPLVERLERVLRPRWPALTSPAFERPLGLLCFVFALVLAAPIPFGNLLPALSICIISLGLLEKDGRAVAVGIAVGFLAILVAAAVLVAILQFGYAVVTRFLI
jgi:hypothetical protein